MLGRILHPNSIIFSTHGAKRVYLSAYRAASHSSSSQDSSHHNSSSHSKKPDPYENWYEFPQSNEVYRHSRLKLPWYIGPPPTSSYRAPSKNAHWFMKWQAMAMGIFLWWWCSWGMMSQPGHVIGEWFYPNRHKWTDEELGIPALDADL